MSNYTFTARNKKQAQLLPLRRWTTTLEFPLNYEVVEPTETHANKVDALSAVMMQKRKRTAHQSTMKRTFAVSTTESRHVTVTTKRWTTSSPT